MMLEVQNLQVQYGAVQALKGISFKIYQGEIVSLIGANGAGKTTTLQALSGLVASSGQVLFLGKKISEMPVDQIAKTGLAHAPEGRGVFAQMTVLENLELGAYTRSDTKEIARDLENCLKMFPRLSERKTQLAGTLSGGEQQMLAICRALMSRPQLLILDEPSLGLAPQIVAQIFSMITELNKKGLTVLLVEQNARMALRISHRAYVLETGQICLSGTGSELLNHDEVRKAYLGVS